MTVYFPFRRCAVTCLALTACVLGLVLEPAAASSVKLPYTEIHEVKLDNGLRALIVETHDAPVIDVQVWYHVGSKNEVPGRTGFAHFFEHLMFDGTKNLGSNEFSDYIIRSGGTDNAYTTEDTTVFWETVPSNMLPVVLWLEADRMRNLEINDKVFNNERQVVEEERRLRFDNPPYGTVVETLYDHAYTVHPYRHMTIGSMEDLNHASIQDIQDFYDTYYVPSNATLLIVGDVDWRQAAVDVQKYFGPVKAGNARGPSAIPQEPAQQAERVVKMNLDVALPAFVEGYHMPADGTPDAYPLRLASKILSDGESSQDLHPADLRQADRRASAEQRKLYRRPQPVFRLCRHERRAFSRRGRDASGSRALAAQNRTCFRRRSGEGQESNPARFHPQPANRAEPGGGVGIRGRGSEGSGIGQHGTATLS